MSLESSENIQLRNEIFELKEELSTVRSERHKYWLDSYKYAQESLRYENMAVRNKRFRVVLFVLALLAVLYSIAATKYIDTCEQQIASLKEDKEYIDYDNTFVPEDYRKGYNDAICGNKPAPEYIQCYNCEYWNPDYSDYIHFFEVNSIWIPLCESCLDSDDIITIMGEDYRFSPASYP